MTRHANAHVPMWLLVLVTLSGTAAIHMFVPALPAAGRDLGSDPATMRTTISLYLVGISVGQLVYGPLADRYGRRPVLITGLTIYGVACIAAALAPTISFLLWSRLAQALGGCAGIALGRTIVRDLAGPNDAARRLAALNMMMMIGPGVAPMVGTIVGDAFGWRAIFGLLGASGLIAAALCGRMLPETHRDIGKLDAAALARGYMALATSPAFLALAIGGGCVTTAMFAFFSSSPYMVAQLGRPAQETSLYLAAVITGVSIGSIAMRRLGLTRDLKQLLRASSIVCLLASVALLGFAGSGALNVPALLVIMFVYSFGAGMSSPVAMTLATNFDDRVIGSAAGLYGSIYMAVGAVCVWLAGLGQDPSLTVATILTGAAVLAQLCFLYAFSSMARRPHHGGGTPVP